MASFAANVVATAATVFIPISCFHKYFILRYYFYFGLRTEQQQILWTQAYKYGRPFELEQ